MQVVKGNTRLHFCTKVAFFILFKSNFGPCLSIYVNLEAEISKKIKLGLVKTLV